MHPVRPTSPFVLEPAAQLVQSAPPPAENVLIEHAVGTGRCDKFATVERHKYAGVSAYSDRH
jgi:hypothetical protein